MSNVIPITNTLSSSSPVENTKKKPGRPPYVLTPEVTKKIVGLTNEGMTQRQISSALNVPLSSVSRACQDAGVSAALAAITKARTDRITFDSERRKKLLDGMIEHAVSLLPTLKSAASLQSYAIGLAVLIDKRKLEDADGLSSGAGAILELVGKLSPVIVAGETT